MQSCGPAWIPKRMAREGYYAAHGRRNAGDSRWSAAKRSRKVTAPAAPASIEIAGKPRTVGTQRAGDSRDLAGDGIDGTQPNRLQTVVQLAAIETRCVRVAVDRDRFRLCALQREPRRKQTRYIGLVFGWSSFHW